MASSPEPAEGSGGAGDEVDDGEVRWPLLAKVGLALAVLTVVGIVVAAVVAAFVVGPKDDDGEAVRIVDDVVDPVAPAIWSRTELIYAGRTTGTIQGVLLRDPRLTTAFGRIADELAVDGQRGVLGLAIGPVDGMEEAFASWTRASDGRLVVGWVQHDRPVVWEGPVSTDVANGGALAFRRDQLLIGVGELQDPDAVDDPTTPNGKILALDVDGPPDQVPTVVAGGFHNPYAIAVDGDVVWVVDNAPGSQPERLVRIAADGATDVLELEGTRAPSSLTVLADGDLALCGYVSGVVERIPVPDEGGPLEPPSEELGMPCRTGVVASPSGGLITLTDDAVWRRLPA